MEILRVDWYMNIADLLDVAATNAAFLSSATARVTALTATALTMDEDAGRPRTFAHAISRFTTTGYQPIPISINMNDGAGNGFLYVGDTITMVAANAGGTATTGTTTAKILFRWVSVKTAELFGVLQAQQAVVT